MDEKKILEFVYSQVAEDVDALYQYYRRKRELEDEKDTERQLEILVHKKYISITYITDLMLIVDYYNKKMYSMYESSLLDYKNRIRFLLER